MDKAVAHQTQPHHPDPVQILITPMFCFCLFLPYWYKHTSWNTLFNLGGQTYTLSRLIYSSMCDLSFMNQLVSIIDSAIAPTIQKAVQSAFQCLTCITKKQTKLLTLENNWIKLMNPISIYKNKRGIQKSLHDLEEYVRRISLRFHNCLETKLCVWILMLLSSTCARQCSALIWPRTIHFNYTFRQTHQKWKLSDHMSLQK